MSVVAEHEGTCPDCGLAIRVGDRIDSSVETIREAFTGRIVRRTVEWTHDICPTPRGTTTCPKCFLERPCPCEDEQ